MIKRAAGWGLLTLLLAICLGGAYWQLFSTFMLYDDEGYVLFSLKNFGLHGALYDQVYSQYGPFFFNAYDALHRVAGFAWTNTNGRWLTLIHWAFTAVMCSAIVRRAIRSWAAAALTLAAVFAALGMMTREPMHPGGSIAFLVALAAWIGATTDITRHRGSAFAVGAIAGALALTKVNVGAFLFLSALLWMLARSADPRLRRWGGWTGAMLVVFLPWALMRSLIAQEWVATYALLASWGMLGIWLVLRSTTPIEIKVSQWAALLAGCAGVIALTVAVTMARGTSFPALLDGVLLGPLKHPGVYFFPFNWRPGTLVFSLLSLGLTVWAIRRVPMPEGLRLALAILRLAAATALCSAIVVRWPVSMEVLQMNVGIIFAGLCAVPLRREPPDENPARVRQWLAALLGLQFLHAYPVAGTQTAWATFLWAPLVILAGHEAWLVLTERAVSPSIRRGYALGATAVAVASFALAAELAVEGRANVQEGSELGLKGAERIVVPDEYSLAFQILAENARAHGSELVTLPGMFSFNLWTDLPTPTLANATHWFSLLQPAQQQAIVAQLEHDSRPVFVIQTGLVAHLTTSGFPITGEVAAYLSQHFEKAFELDSYAFWVRRGRKIAALSTATSVASTADPSRAELTAIFAAPPEEIAAIEIWHLRGNAKWREGTLDPVTTTLSASPIDESGQAIGPAALVNLNQALPAGLVQLKIGFQGRPPAARDSVIILRDRAGTALRTLRVIR